MLTRYLQLGLCLILYCDACPYIYISISTATSIQPYVQSHSTIEFQIEHQLQIVPASIKTRTDDIISRVVPTDDQKPDTTKRYLFDWCETIRRDEQLLSVKRIYDSCLRLRGVEAHLLVCDSTMMYLVEASVVHKLYK